jgi:hypothetical protein
MLQIGGKYVASVHTMTPTNSSVLSLTTLAAVGALLSAPSAEAAVELFEPAGPLFTSDSANSLISWSPVTLNDVTVSGASTSPIQFFSCNGVIIQLTSNPSLGISDVQFDVRSMDALAANDTIDGSSAYTQTFFPLTNGAGTWAAGNPFFIGYSFTFSGNTHYGWAEFVLLDVVGNIAPELGLIRWAYENQPSASVNVGQEPIPELSTFGALVGCAVLGLATYRRPARLSL